MLSLCRTFGRLEGGPRLQFYLTDDEDNLDVDAVLTDVLDTIDAVHGDGHPVLVHCYGGASRTGLVLRAHLRRREHLDAEQATRRAGQLWPHLGLWNSSFDAALHRLPST